MTKTAAKTSRPWYRVLYIQVLIAIAIGIAVGHFFPDTGKALKPLGDGFIALIKMMIAPVIFCTVVHGIGSMRDLEKVGRIGVKTLFYFEVVSTLALGDRPARRRGAAARQGLQHRSGLARSRRLVASYVTRAKEEGIVAHLLASSPTASSARSPAAICCRCCWCRSCPALPSRGWASSASRSTGAIDAAAKMFFGIIRMIVQVAPIGAFGAMAFTIGAYGLGLAGQPRGAGRDLLPDQHPVRAGGARHHRAFRRLLDPALHRLHQGRAADRARHLVLGNRAAAHDRRRCSTSARRSRWSAW